MLLLYFFFLTLAIAWYVNCILWVVVTCWICSMVSNPNIYKLFGLFIQGWGMQLVHCSVVSITVTVLYIFYLFFSWLCLWLSVFYTQLTMRKKKKKCIWAPKRHHTKYQLLPCHVGPLRKKKTSFLIQM